VAYSTPGQTPVAVVQDRLGSVGKYYPYGEERNAPQLPNDQVKFATYTRDSATGNDYADQRYYSSALGRFMTADASSRGFDPRSPATWNRYTYVLADPINHGDPAGTDCTSYSQFDANGSLVTSEDWGCTGVPGDYFGPSAVGYGPSDFYSVTTVAMSAEIGAAGIDLSSLAVTISGRFSASGALSAFSTTAFSDDCKGFIAYSLGKDLSAIQTIAAAAQVTDASTVITQAGAALFPNNPDYAAAQQARADADSATQNASIAQWFAAMPTIHAATQYNGNTIYYSALYFSQIGSGTAMYTMFHESLHLAGYDDQQLRALLGIADSEWKAWGSDAITHKLEEKCGH